MSKRYPIRAAIALMLVTVSATFVISILFFRQIYGINSDVYREAAKYLEAREIISEFYVGEYDETELTDTSIKAAIEALEDNWSYYLTADEHEIYKRNLNNQYEGIGITYERTEPENYMMIEAVTVGSPAHEAGLVAGDIIREIDGQPVADMENIGVRELILSKVGQSVALSVENAEGAERSVEVECKEYYVDPISYELLEGDIGYIAIANFDTGSGDGAVSAIEDLMEQGADALIFDVRNNGGGLVTELLKLLDYLLPEGELFITVDKDGNESIKSSDEKSLEMPISVLVNAKSYSAAEYFAAILQEYERAEIVGEATTGKGRSQITVELDDGSAIHISSKSYHTPKGVDLSETGGIVPDYTVENSETDSQLEKAKEVLK